MADAGNSNIIRKASPQTKQGSNYGYPGVTGSGKSVPNMPAKPRSNNYNKSK